MYMKYLHMGAFALLVVGGLNWLLTAFGYNIVELIFGTSMISMLIYLLIGASAVFEVATHKKYCKMCNPDSEQSMDGGTL
ncbi:DUF378 domain-containing protein [Candidatus Parcubacteria bacterium]|nr:MAG: DUF378 domain-containing protein [Candidatus Parcubacteria bacterium]